MLNSNSIAQTNALPVAFVPPNVLSRALSNTNALSNALPSPSSIFHPCNTDRVFCSLNCPNPLMSAQSLAASRSESMRLPLSSSTAFSQRTRLFMVNPNTQPDEDPWKGKGELPEPGREPKFYEMIGVERQDHHGKVGSILKELSGANISPINDGPDQQKSIEFAMQRWLTSLPPDHVEDEHEEALSAVRSALTQCNSLNLTGFNRLYQSIKKFDFAQQLLLDLSILFGLKKMMAWLLERGVMTPGAIDLALRCNNADFMTLFVEIKTEIDLNALKADGDQPWADTLLHKAVKLGSEPIVEALLKAGPERVDVNQRDESGTTALLLATDSGDEALALKLIEHGADPMLKNFSDESPLSLAIERIAAQYVYDLESGSWSVEKREVEEGAAESSGGLLSGRPSRIVILDAFIDAAEKMMNEGGMKASDIDQAILRLMSADSDQSENLMALHRLKARVLFSAEVESPLTSTFKSKSKEQQPMIASQDNKVIEPIIAVGHAKNIETGIKKLGVDFPPDLVDLLLKQYNRQDLEALIGGG